MSSNVKEVLIIFLYAVIVNIKMMKVLLLLNVNTLLLALLLVKKEVKRVKNLPKMRSSYQMGQKGGQKGSTIYRVHGSKRRSTWVKNLTKKEVLPKMGHKGGQKGSKI